MTLFTCPSSSISACSTRIGISYGSPAPLMHPEYRQPEALTHDTIWANGEPSMANCSRRNFLKTGLAGGFLAATGGLPVRAASGKATDWVTLGKSNIKVTRLAFGTGTF